MPSIVFNGATISFDEPLDFFVIRGKLVIDTASYTSKHITKPTQTKTVTKRSYGLSQFIRESKPKIGKKLLVKSNSKKSIYGVYKKLGFTASISDTTKPGEYMVTCQPG